MTLVLPSVIRKVSNAIQVIPFLHHYQNYGSHLISDSASFSRPSVLLSRPQSTKAVDSS